MDETKRIVLDTNVLVSAFLAHGNPRKIFMKILDEKFVLLISKQQRIELAKVLWVCPSVSILSECVKSFPTSTLSLSDVRELLASAFPRSNA